MNKIISKIRADLKRDADEKTKIGFERFFKEKIKCYGVKSEGVKRIAKKYWPAVKILNKKEIFDISEELFKSDYAEEASIVAIWLPKISKTFEPGDIETFKNWISKYINNWAKCDGFCNHTVGDFVEKYPSSITEVKSWSKSKNRWLKRASAVSLILPAKHGKYLKDVFVIADELLTDPDDMVQKGYGWLLKEASREHQKEVFDYVMKNKAKMPRTALRYAIEKMPEKMKKEAMKK